MLCLLQEAKEAAIPARHVLFDTWFCSPTSLLSVHELGYEVVAMAKKTEKIHYLHEGVMQDVKAIYRKRRKRRGRSKYLLSVEAAVRKGAESLPARLVFVRNRNNRKDWLVLVTTDMRLTEEEVSRIHGKRWGIEVFFKVCKSYLNLSKECNSLSYDAMTAHTAVVFTRYIMLSLESRESNDNRSLGELFLYFSDEMSDITWIQAFQLLLQMFRTILSDNTELSDEKINELVDTFMNTLPTMLKTQLQAA